MAMKYLATGTLEYYEIFNTILMRWRGKMELKKDASSFHFFRRQHSRKLKSMIDIDFLNKVDESSITQSSRSELKIRLGGGISTVSHCLTFNAALAFRDDMLYLEKNMSARSFH